MEEFNWKGNMQNFEKYLKVQSCKLYNDKSIIASTEKTNIEIFAFIGVSVFKLLSPKVLFINTKLLQNYK